LVFSKSTRIIITIFRVVVVIIIIIIIIISTYLFFSVYLYLGVKLVFTHLRGS